MKLTYDAAALLSEVNALTIDDAVRTYTAFESFEDMLTSARKDAYAPTLPTAYYDDTEQGHRVALVNEKIADTFDAKMVEEGLSNRAYRGRQSRR